MLQHLLSFSPSTLALLSSSLLALWFILPASFDPLRSIPGPFLARFTRFWYFFSIYQGKFEQVNIELHRRYGPIVRVAPGEYSIDDIAAAKTIYGHGQGFTKAPWYWAWMPPDPSKASLFSDRDPHRHSAQRRKFASLYSMSSLVGYEPFVDNCSRLLVQRFEELRTAGREVDLQKWLQCYAFDVIGEITFGSRFGFLDLGEDKEGVFTAIDERGVYSTFVGIFPWLHRWLYPLLPKTGGHGYVFNYTLKKIDAAQKALKDPRIESREGPPDIMTKILQAHEADPDKMTRTDLITMCQSNIGAGSDTTAISLSSIFYHLTTYPSTLQNLRNEIDDAEKEGRLSNPITFKEAQELPYLQAVIKESLRNHPATGLPMQRIVPPSGCHIAGHFLPGGSSVGINAWVAHQNPVFGPDAEVFRPERWLEGGGAEMEKYFFAFGMGSRTCIGKNISLLEVSKLVPELVRRFGFVLAEECGKGGGLRCENRWFVKQVNFWGRVVGRGEKTV